MSSNVGNVDILHLTQVRSKEQSARTIDARMRTHEQ